MNAEATYTEEELNELETHADDEEMWDYLDMLEAQAAGCREWDNMVGGA